MEEVDFCKDIDWERFHHELDLVLAQAITERKLMPSHPVVLLLQYSNEKRKTYVREKS